MVQPAAQRVAQRLRSLRPRRQLVQRQRELLHPRVRGQLALQPDGLLRRVRVRQRRHEHRLWRRRGFGRLGVRGVQPESRPVQPAVRQRQPRRRPDAADDRAVRVLAVHARPLGRHRADHHLPALLGRRPAGVRQPVPVDEPGQRDQPRLRRRLGRRRAPRLHGQDQPVPRGRRRLREQGRHGRVRQVRGPVRRERRLRHPVVVRRGRHAHAGRPLDDRAGLRADLLRRRLLGKQPQRAHLQLLRRRQQRVPGRQQRRGLRLAGRRRVEGRRPVQAERRVDAACRLQPQRQPDRVAGRDVQHPRPGRDEEPLHARRHLEDRREVRAHQRVHVRAARGSDRPEPVRVRQRPAPPGAPPTTTETIGMRQYELGVAYQRRF